MPTVDFEKYDSMTLTTRLCYRTQEGQFGYTVREWQT